MKVFENGKNILKEMCVNRNDKEIIKKRTVVIIKTLLCLCFFGFVSCKTVPTFNEKVELCGLVLDMQNKPVDQAVVICFQNNIEKQRTITNNRGLFVFNDIPGGKYEITIEKNGWMRVEKTPVLFSNKNDVYCFQLNSGDFVLDEVEKLFEKAEYKNGLNVLEQLCYEPKSPVHAIFCFYSAYGNLKLGEKKKGLECIKELKKMKCVDIDLSKITGLLEVL